MLARPSGRAAARLGLTVSRRVAKRAVDRNKLKRLAREVLSAAARVAAVGLRRARAQRAPTERSAGCCARVSTGTSSSLTKAARGARAAWITSACFSGSRCSAWCGSRTRRGQADYGAPHAARGDAAPPPPRRRPATRRRRLPSLNPTAERRHRSRRRRRRRPRRPRAS